MVIVLQNVVHEITYFTMHTFWGNSAPETQRTV